MSVDKEFLDNIVAFVKKNRERALTTAERLDILLLQGFLRYEPLKKKRMKMIVIHTNRTKITSHFIPISNIFSIIIG